MNLKQLGWNSFFEEHFSPYTHSDFFPARVCNEQKNLYHLYCEDGEVSAELSGKLLYGAVSRSDLPVVGDWVAIHIPGHGERAIIHGLLPRKSYFSRKSASGSERRSGGLTEEQIIAANVDTVLLVSGLDRDFNLRRLERYLTMVYNSGASPVIVLNKADLCDDVEQCVMEVESIAFGLPIHPISAADQQGLEALQPYIQPGKTVSLLGSSGVGKSTIINALLGYERQKVTQISEHVGKGQHTTTSRQLILLPNSGMLVDNPGMRELQVWGRAADVAGTFHDIEMLAQQCRFSDCQHESEPGCAVQAAIERGELKEKRLRSYRKLKNETEFFEQRREQSADYLERKKWKRIAKYSRVQRKYSFKP